MIVSKVTARTKNATDKFHAEISPRRRLSGPGKLAFFQFLMHDVRKQVVQAFIEFFDNVHVA